LRATDVAIRWGGDEFLVILPGTDIEEAAAIAERLAAQMTHRNTTLGRPVTASIGVASISEATLLNNWLN